MEFQFHCDNCGKSLGAYLYGRGGVEEKAHITGIYNNRLPDTRLPDIICNECLKEGTKQSNLMEDN
jgi:hypothetical protein